MGFSISPVGLLEAVRQPIRQIEQELFGRLDTPPSLHHYTCAETVTSIIQSRRVWATCVADQDDSLEVLHATAIVGEEARKLSGSCSSSTGDILNDISSFMDARRSWFYIACFCGKLESEFHFRKYGPYCLTFSPPWKTTSALTLGSSSADCWYQPVIYDVDIQVGSLRRALVSIREAIDSYTRGTNEGPWKSTMSLTCARIAGEMLLAIVLGFKAPQFRDDQEWRMVCSPRVNPLSTAPMMADEAFQGLIKRNVRKHIELMTPSNYNAFAPISIPSVPFTKIHCDRRAATKEERVSIINALIANGRVDLCSGL